MESIVSLHQKKTESLAKVRELNNIVLSMENDLSIARERLAFWDSLYKETDYELAVATKLVKVKGKKLSDSKSKSKRTMSKKDAINEIVKDPALAAKILSMLAQNYSIKA